MKDCGDNTRDPDRDPGTSVCCEGGTAVMGGDRRSIRAGSWMILLVATATQGFTPDHDNLVSSRILRLVTAGLAETDAADSSHSPLSTPLPCGEHDGVPGGVCSKVAAESVLPLPPGPGVHQRIQFLPDDLRARPGRSAPCSFNPPGGALPGSGGLIPSLCRFLC